MKRKVPGGVKMVAIPATCDANSLVGINTTLIPESSDFFVGNR